MKKFFPLVFALIIFGRAGVAAQQTEALQGAKPKVSIRPNSREYAPLRRSNDHQRITPAQRKLILREARLHWQKKMLIRQGSKYYYRKQIMMNQRNVIIHNRGRR